MALYAFVGGDPQQFMQPLLSSDLHDVSHREQDEPQPQGESVCDAGVCVV